MSQYITLETQGPVATVTLNRPEIHNAFDDVLVSQLYETAISLGKQEGIRVVVLGGAGKSFCAGADLNWMKRMVSYTHEENVADSTAMAGMFEAWNTLPKPVIGRIHGAALGGGTGLVAVCDIPVASNTATFGFSEVRLGIVPAVYLSSQAIATDEYSYSTRVDALLIMLEIIKVNPILGFGPANYTFYTPLQTSRPINIECFFLSTTTIFCVMKRKFWGFFHYPKNG